MNTLSNLTNQSEIIEFKKTNSVLGQETIREFSNTTTNREAVSVDTQNVGNVLNFKNPTE
jgi:hypothetical protein